MTFRSLSVLLAILTATVSEVSAVPKTRLMILADMGNEPDEMQQMAHMLACSNMFELEGLIAVTGKYLRPGKRQEYHWRVHPELFHQLIDGYEKVRPNLLKHADGWPTAAYLHSIVRSGQSEYGIADVGEGRTSEGAQLILDALDRDDPRPIWVVVNAGSNTLAQALYVVANARSAHELRAAISKLRVFENGSQDNAGAWITSEFPEIYWIRSNYQTYAYGGPGARAVPEGMALGPHQWKPFDYSTQGQAEWTAEHVQKNHGALGALYPDRRFHNGALGFLEGGGTIPWMGLVNHGLFDIEHPNWGGWGGRFTEKKVACFWSRHGDIRPDEERMAPFYTYREASDVWTDPQDGVVYQGDFVPVWRFRPAMYADFRARMDWCVLPFAEANHHPIASIDGDTSDSIIRINVMPGDSWSFDAGDSSDPDGDALRYQWWIYEEAGTYAGKVVLHGADSRTVSLAVPSGAQGRQLHLILEVTDDHPEVQLTDYRRVVIDVSEHERWSPSPQSGDKNRFDLLPISRE